MPSSTIHPPGYYLAHWHASLRFLAMSPQDKPASVRVIRVKTLKALGTEHTKARAMKQSILSYPAWGAEIRELAASGRLTFRQDRANLWLVAETRPRQRSIAEILEKAQVVANSD